MSTLEMFIAEGKAEKNREACINMINLGFENEMICKILDVTPEFVQALRRELAEKSDGQDAE